MYYPCANLLERSLAVMAIYKYFSRKDEFMLPIIHTCGDSSLSKREVDKANYGVAYIAQHGVMS